MPDDWAIIKEFLSWSQIDMLRPNRSFNKQWWEIIQKSQLGQEELNSIASYLRFSETHAWKFRIPEGTAGE